MADDPRPRDNFDLVSIALLAFFVVVLLVVAGLLALPMIVR
jgi:hypothetical protein